MAQAPHPVEMHGLMFASTGDGHLLESEVHQHLDALMERLEGLERENAELHGRLEHLDSLQRLAQETVIKADELASAIEADARQRADELVLQSETEMVERQRQFDANLAAQEAAAQARVTQLQAALEGSVQTLARALQAVGAPALEMPPASSSAWASSAATAQTPTAPANGQAAPLVESPSLAPEPEASEFTRFDMAPADALPAADDVTPAPASEAEVPVEPAAADADGAEWAHAIPEGASVAEEPPASGEWRPPESPAAEWDAPPQPATGWEQSPLVEQLGAASPSENEAVSSPEAVEDDLELVPIEAEEPAPVAPVARDRADEPAAASPDAGPTTATGLSRTGPATLEIDMRPVKSFADLARVTRLLGRIAPGAQPVDLNLPQHRALFSVRGKDVQALAAQLQEALPEAKIVTRDDGLDVLLEEA
jgi:hypothetical protein